MPETTRTARRPDLLCLFVLHRAEQRVEALLDAIPDELLGPGAHVLVIDDASRDGTIERAERWVARRGARNVTLLENPVPQGPGGSQKLGYRLAVDAGFGFVVYVADGEHADPRQIPRVLEPRRE